MLPITFCRTATLTLILLASATLQAQQPLPVSLKGSAEVPPISTAATGTGQITIMLDRTLSGSIKTVGMVATVAHIHEAPIGKNGPPIITLNKTADDSFVVPAGALLSEAQYASFVSGKLYVNVHSAAYPNGEIRAQLMHPEKVAMPMGLPY